MTWNRIKSEETEDTPFIMKNSQTEEKMTVTSFDFSNTWDATKTTPDGETKLIANYDTENEAKNRIKEEIDGERALSPQI